MTIVTGTCKKFLEELPLGIHTLFEGTPDTIKVALYGPNAVLSPYSETYTSDGEVSGGGYTAGGQACPMTVVGATGSSRSGGMQFEHPYIQPTSDLSITVAGVGVRGFMIYNASQGNRAMFIGDFGEIKTPSTGILFSWAVADITQWGQVLIPLIGLNS